eukprot:tig00020903_g15116.t1
MVKLPAAGVLRKELRAIYRGNDHDTLTFRKVLRLLENSLSLPDGTLDSEHKIEIKAIFNKIVEEDEEEASLTSSDEAVLDEKPAEVKKSKSKENKELPKRERAPNAREKKESGSEEEGPKEVCKAKKVKKDKVPKATSGKEVKEASSKGSASDDKAKKLEASAKAVGVRVPRKLASLSPSKRIAELELLMKEEGVPPRVLTKQEMAKYKGAIEIKRELQEIKATNIVEGRRNIKQAKKIEPVYEPSKPRKRHSSDGENNDEGKSEPEGKKSKLLDKEKKAETSAEDTEAKSSEEGERDEESDANPSESESDEANEESDEEFKPDGSDDDE